MKSVPLRGERRSSVPHVCGKPRKNISPSSYGQHTRTKAASTGEVPQTYHGMAELCHAFNGQTDPVRTPQALPLPQVQDASFCEVKPACKKHQASDLPSANVSFAKLDERRTTIWGFCTRPLGGKLSDIPRSHLCNFSNSSL